MRARIGVDIGGTFTDVALETLTGLTTTKILTDLTAPEAAIIKGIKSVCKSAEIELNEIDQIIHGTTLVTNSVIERRGAKTAFITTEGFRDVIEMRSENRFEQYDLDLVLPTPLVPREDRMTAHERVAASGEILLHLEDRDIKRLVDTVGDRGYESVAIGFIHSYANSIHERKMAQALSEAIPSISISLSSVISPQMRELPRFNSVIVNAYVQPQMAVYLKQLVLKIKDIGIKPQIFMMHSGGGIISVETAIEQPIRLLESGPAGGAIYAAGYAGNHAIEKALSFDMGGTTAKICMIDKGMPKSASTFETARSYRFKKGSGITVSTPVVEMVEIGAGGGSIASIDKLGCIQVGPKSAGSDPGPACYQNGGNSATVTDANLIIGRLDKDRFAGGSIPLAPHLSAAAIEQDISQLLNLPIMDAAHGITEIVDENMANAARVHTIEHGEDIEKFTMIAFGGGAPLHASRLCEKLGIKRILIPPGAGVGSAIGFLRAPFSYEATRGFYQTLGIFNNEAVNKMLDGLEDEATSFVLEGVGASDTTKQLRVFMRYAGQGWEIPVLPDVTRFEVADVFHLRACFEKTYRNLFGRTINGLDIEITNWSFTISTTVCPPDVIPKSESQQIAKLKSECKLFDVSTKGVLKTSIVQRADMQMGDFVVGPAIIIEDETSIIVSTQFRAIMQANGAILIEREGLE